MINIRGLDDFDIVFMRVCVCARALILARQMENKETDTDIHVNKTIFQICIHCQSSPIITLFTVVAEMLESIFTVFVQSCTCTLVKAPV